MTSWDAKSAVAEGAVFLGTQLLETATLPGERVVIQALIEEGTILSREQFRLALVWERADGRAECAWQRLANRLYGLGLSPHEFAFLDLVLSAAGAGHQTSLAKAIDLDERRTRILLRAIARLSGNDRLLAADTA